MKVFILAIFMTLLFAACQNSNINHNQLNITTESDAEISISTQNNQYPKIPTPLIISELKSDNQWQILPFNYDNLSDDWRLLTVSDEEYNDLDLPIVKKDKFSIEFSKSIELNNYWIFMPNNCNSMSGEFILTKTGIKIAGNLLTTQMFCAELPKELDDDLIHQAVLKGNYQIFEKNKQRLLKISHNNQHWFFYSYDPNYPYGLLKSFKKDRHNFESLEFHISELLNDWRLYAVSDNNYNPIQLPLWQKNAKERYQLTFKMDDNNDYWLSMPNYCNHIKVPFSPTKKGIIADMTKIITTNQKCDVPEAYKDANESIIHHAVYHGEYQLLFDKYKSLLKISHDNMILFFIAEDDNHEN